VIGIVGGAAVWYVWSDGGKRLVPSRPLLAVLLLTYTLRALEPFAVRAPVDFSWIPFAGSLEGNMLANLRALAASAFVLGGCVWLMRSMEWNALRTTVGLAAWVLVLEVAQRWIVGRAPDSTEPVLALLAGWVLSQVESDTLGQREWQRQAYQRPGPHE
jgi:hypothetical protein